MCISIILGAISSWTTRNSCGHRIDVLVQERRNTIVNTLELRIFLYQPIEIISRLFTDITAHVNFVNSIYIHERVITLLFTGCNITNHWQLQIRAQSKIHSYMHPGPLFIKREDVYPPSLEGTRLDVIMIVSLRNLTDISAAWPVKY